eukprot:12431475-Karenia_brevis.AAC.3
MMTMMMMGMVMMMMVVPVANRMNTCDEEARRTVLSVICTFYFGIHLRLAGLRLDVCDRPYNVLGEFATKLPCAPQ